MNSDSNDNDINDKIKLSEIEIEIGTEVGTEGDIEAEVKVDDKVKAEYGGKKYEDNHDFEKRQRIVASVKKYIITVAAIVGLFVVVSGALVFAYSSMKKSAGEGDEITQGERPYAEQNDKNPSDGNNNVGDDNNEQSGANNGNGSGSGGESGNDTQSLTEPTNKPSNLLEEALTPPRKTNILIIGTDQSGLLADVQIVASYDFARQEVNFVSIPRDTYVELSKADVNELKAKKRPVPSDGIMKINELHSYAGKKEGHIYLRRVIEGMLSVEIDYYVEIDLRAFRKIVDAVGGIYMDIRAEGYKYDDPEQNLHMNIPGGYQRLDGENAEHLVRYRDDYANGDLDRIPVQQDFMNEFIKQVMRKETVMGNLMEFYTVLADYVMTDFGVDKFILYAEALTKINPENVTFQLIPGRIYEPVVNGVKLSYYKYDPAKTMVMVSELFNNFDEPDPTPTPTPTVTPTFEPVVQDLKKMKIQILNGGNIEGKAAEVRNTLRAAGYTITSLGNYKGTQKAETRIMTRYDVETADLQKFFKNTITEVDGTLKDADYDIIIIIGTGEK